ncbi:MAG: ParA family protein [Candidatus Sericytochromatia bacterium]
MRAGKVLKILEVAKPTLLRKVEENFPDIDKTVSGENIFRWKHITKLSYLKKYGAKLPNNNVISIAQNKGGVGKTSSVINLAHLFSYLGRTLVIDLDSQSNLSQSFGIYLTEKDLSLSDVFENPEVIKDTLKNIQPNLDLLPNHLKFEKWLKNNKDKKHKPFTLKKALKSIKDDYDFIIIDTPPSLAFALEMGLYASNYCIIPFQAHPFAMDGIINIIDEIKTISKKDETGNFDLEILGVFVNNYEENVLFNQIAGHIENSNKFNVFKTKIRKTVAIPQSQAVKQSVFDFDENAKVCYEYFDLFFEILNKIIK